MNNYLIPAVAGLFGILFHILMAVRQLNNALPGETYNTVFAEYFKKDLLCLLGSVLSVAFVIFVAAPYMKAGIDKPVDGDAEDWFLYYLLHYLRFSFAFVGYIGDSLIFSIFGTIGKKLADKGLTTTPKP